MIAAQGAADVGGQLLIVSVLVGAVRSGTSIFYAALGETISERAGVLNVGTEGCMLAGALSAYAVTAETGSPWAGVLGAALVGGALALLHAYLVIARGANQLANGLVIMFLGLGLTSLFGAAYVSREVKGFEPFAIPGLSSIPAVGDILFNHDPLTYLSFLLGPAVWFLLFRTRWGLLLRGAGERAAVLSSYGYSPEKTRYVAVGLGGVLAGIGGAQLSTAVALTWFENMTQGRGFIAVALVIFASWHPLWAMGGAYLFGAALALGPELQVRNVGVNQFALDALPYVMTLVVLVVLAKRSFQRAPEALAEVFDAPPVS